MKEKLKKIPFLGKMLLYIKALSLYWGDMRIFVKNFIKGNRNNNTIEYDILLEVHKLEKGMACKNLRPFGVQKIKKIIELILEYKKKGYQHEKSFAVNLAINSLAEYKRIYEEMSWVNKEEYKIVTDFLRNYKENSETLSGAYDLYYKNIKDKININYYEFLRSRHSVRNYANKKLLKEDVEKAIEMAIMSPSACNRQMCKIYEIEKNKEVVEKYAQGLSLFDLSNVNYFIVTFDTSAFYFLGERNQGWFNAGLFSMNFVNALHSLGIGSCFIQFGNSFKEEEEFKNKLDIPHSERVAVIITLGYYDKVSRIPYSTRKPIEEIYRKR